MVITRPVGYAGKPFNQDGNGNLSIVLSGSNAVEQVEHITTDTVIIAGAFWRSNIQTVGSTIESRVSGRLSAATKLKVLLEHWKDSARTMKLNDSVIDDNSTTADAFIGGKADVFGALFTTILIQNVDTVDTTVRYLGERRLKHYA